MIFVNVFYENFKKFIFLLYLTEMFEIN